MFPHVAEALDIVKERSRQREAKQLHARRTYARSLLLGELPLGGANALADAVEELALSLDDFRRDAELALSCQKLNDELSRLHEQSKDAVAAAKAEDPRWHPDADPDDFPSPGPAILAADRTLLETARQMDLIRTSLRQIHGRCSRLYSQETRSLLQSLPREAVVPATVLRFNSPEGVEKHAEPEQNERHEKNVGTSNDRNPVIKVATQQPQLAPAPTATPESWT